MSFYDPLTTGEVIQTGPWDSTTDDIVRSATLEAIAKSLADEMLGRYLGALERLYYPDVYPEMYYIAAAADASHPTRVTYQLQIPGIARLGTVLMMDVDGTYPSAVNVYIDALGHMPFTLSSLKSEIGPFAFKIFGGTGVTLENVDTAHACRLYIEWVMWKGHDE